MDDQIKVMYFAPIPRSKSRAEFKDRWRRHGRFAMTLPLWRFIDRYQHFDAMWPGEFGLTDETCSAAGIDVRLGGVGCTWYRDRGTLDENLDVYDEALPLLKDEEEAFGRQLGTDVVPVVEKRFISRRRPQLALLSGFSAVPGVGREDFSVRWHSAGEKLVAIPEVERHLVTFAQNHSLDGFEGRDGLVEYGFAAAEDLAAFLAEPMLAEWTETDESPLIDSTRTQTIIGAEHVLFDCP